MYILGGSDGGSTYYNDVQYAPIEAAGSVGSYNTTNPLYAALWGQASVAYNGYLYVLGGYDSNNVYHNDVKYAQINSDGSLGSWTATTSFTTPRWEQGAVAYNGYLYIFGGQYYNGSANVDLNDVQYAPINSNGTIGSWTATTSFTTGAYFFGAVAYNGYLYMVGGYNDANGTLSSVLYAPINSNGTIGSWNPTTSLGTAVYALGAVAYNGYLYNLGGSANSGDVNTVQYAPINSNGTIGSWTSATGFNGVREQFAAVVNDGYIYIIGGLVNGQLTNNVQYAPIESNGSVGSWTTTTPLSSDLRLLSAVVNNGYLYILGGQDNLGNNSSTVQYASIGDGGEGTAGTWNTTTSFTTGW
jgi:hypothetical protein